MKNTKSRHIVNKSTKCDKRITKETDDENTSDANC